MPKYHIYRERTVEQYIDDDFIAESEEEAMETALWQSWETRRIHDGEITVTTVKEE